MLLAAGRVVVSKTSAYNITKLSYRVEVRVGGGGILQSYPHRNTHEALCSSFRRPPEKSARFFVGFYRRKILPTKDFPDERFSRRKILPTKDFPDERFYRRKILPTRYRRKIAFEN